MPSLQPPWHPAELRCIFIHLANGYTQYHTADKDSGTAGRRDATMDRERMAELA
jgi:hypothetical protein